MKLNVFMFLYMIFFFSACKKDDANTINSTPPEITFVSISPTEIMELSEEMELVFTYTDKEGDLGDPDPDEHSLELKDARLSSPDFYHIPPQDPGNTTLTINGQLKVILRAPFVLGNSFLEETFFTFRIKDRAGNWSNELETPIITIQKDTVE